MPDRDQLRHWVAARQTPLDAKALPNHHGQVSWLIASWQKSSQGLSPNDVVSAIQQRNYSCATAHGFHVIPSWQP